MITAATIRVCMDAPGDKRGVGSTGRDLKGRAEKERNTEMAVAGLPGPEPQTPDVLAILEIHRHRDGVVTFHRKGKQPGQFENLFGIRAKDLPERFSGLREALNCDSYFSINAFWHPDQKSEWLSATEARQSGRLRFLCAAYTDLDIHNVELNFGTALAKVLEYQDEGVIPPASLIVRSGRGMWLLWLLHDPKNPGQPPRAFPEKLRLYLQVNRAIGELLCSLGADPAARDAVRLMRVPGSVHPLATECLRVKYWIQASEQGKPYSYTLDDLTRWFRIASPDLAPVERKALLEAERPAGSRARGFAQLNARRLREFSLLRAMRGGFAEGCRNHALLVYAWLLRCSRVAPDTILREAQTLAAECKPPLSAVETRQAVKTARNRRFVRLCDQTISDWLGVTLAECAYLEKLPPASRFGRKQDAAPEKSRQVERRAALRQILQEHPSVPSCREMVRLLRNRQIEVSHTQVLRDYKALAIEAGT